MSWEFSKKLGAISAGVLSSVGIYILFDYVLYPVVMLHWHLRGTVFMACFATVFNYCVIVLYRHTKLDWYGFEFLREVRTGEGRGLKQSVAKRAFRMGHWPMYIALSAFIDPALGFIFLRGRTTLKRFNHEDWGVFILSNLIGNATLIITILGVNALWRRIF